MSSHHPHSASTVAPTHTAHTCAHCIFRCPLLTRCAMCTLSLCARWNTAGTWACCSSLTLALVIQALIGVIVTLCVTHHSSTPQPQQLCLTCFAHPSLLPPQPSKRYDSTPRVADARFDNAAALQVTYYEQAGTPHLCSNHDTPPAPPSSGLQVIVHAGETLYVPSYWTHFIVSLDTSFQCNCRSGQTSAGLKHVAECGFVGPTIIDPDMYVLVEWALQPNRAMPMLLTHSHSHTHHCSWTFERRIKADKIRAQVQRTPAARYSATDGGGGDTAPPSAPTQDPTLSLPPPSLPPAQRVVPGVSTPALRPGVAPNGSPNTQQRSYGPSVRSSHGAGNSRRSGADDGGADGGPSALAIGIFGALIGMGLCVFAVLIVRTASKRLGGPFQGQRRAPSLPSLRV